MPFELLRRIDYCLTDVPEDFAFVKEYFAPSIAGTFAILGVLLIDKDNNGIPDEWEKEKEK